MTIRKHTRLGLLSALGASVILLLASAAPASAAEPAWRIDSVANTTALPGATITYHLNVANVGSADANGEEVLTTIALPAGLTAVSASGLEPGIQLLTCTAGDGSSPVEGATAISCPTSYPVPDAVNDFPGSTLRYTIVTEVASGVQPPRTLTASMGVAGGGAAASATTVDPTRIEALPPFGVDAFDADVAADPAGIPSTDAAAHPYSDTTSFDFNTITDPRPTFADLWPVEPTRDIVLDLPSGLVGGTAGLARCSSADLANGFNTVAQPLCPAASQVGVTLIRANGFSTFPVTLGSFPVFNMVPPPGAPARFGFNVLGTVVTFNARLRSIGDYGLSIDVRGVSEGLDIAGTSTTFWGVPSDPSHDSERGCPGENAPSAGGPICTSSALPRPFFRNPTSCTEKPTEGLPTSLHIDSWANPGIRDANGEPVEEAAWQGATSVSHEPPGYPLPTEPSTFPAGYSGPEEQGEEVGIEGCDEVLFEPEISVAPTTNQADSPSGLTFDLTIPQNCWDAKETVAEAEGALCQSDLKTAEVTLLAGMSVNPSSADGLGACTASEIGLTTPEGQTPIHFDTADPSCPESSKIGTVEIETPLVEEHLKGAVYLAAQNDNPFKSLLALYIVARGNGILIKLPAHVEADPATGRLTTVTDELPQLPFSHLHLELKSGPRAALITPATCGTYSTQATLTPYSGNEAIERQSSFQITQGPNGAPCPSGGFDPQLSAGTTNPLAGATSPFVLRLSRADGTQQLRGLSVKLPQGLLAYLKGIPYCSDAALNAVSEAEGTAAAQFSSPACPAASQVGTVSVGAGAGPNPFYVNTGKAYWAGPYKGAPVSLAIITPALAGPFDLGSALVRTRFEVDPETAAITAVSDPIPTILHGLPLDVRDVRVNLDRPDYTLNPTSCDPMAFDATLSGAEGATAQRTERFQALGCDRLAFKPKLSFRLKGSVRRTANPSLIATLKGRAGEANIARAQVKLPPAAFLDNSHIGQVCTRVQFAADQCPAASVYGEASATSPILGYPLYGKVYLRSSTHQLPDLLVALRGPDSQPIEVDLAGKTDSVKGALRNTFELIPDAPVDTFRLRLFGGKKGLIQMSSGFCRSPRATVKLDGQNGKTHDTTPIVHSSCPKSGKPHKRHH